MFEGKRPQFQPRPDPVPSACDPLCVAATFVTFASGNGSPVFTVNRMHSPVPAKVGGEELGVRFLFESDSGESGMIYFFSGFASVWPDGEPMPRQKVATAMIASTVDGYAEMMQATMSLVMMGDDLAGRITH